MTTVGVRACALVWAFLTIAILSGQACGHGGGGGNGGGGEEPPPNDGVGYRVFFPSLPANAVNQAVRDFKVWNDGLTGDQYALAVGFNLVRPYQAFVYDHTGYLDPTETERYYSIHDLYPTLPAWVPSTHSESIFYGVNTSGRVVGVFRDPNDTTQNIPFYFDLKATIRQLHPILIPAFASGPIGLHQQVNETGDMLVPFESILAGADEAFVFNPGDVFVAGDDEYVQLLDHDGTQLDTEISLNSTRLAKSLSCGLMDQRLCDFPSVALQRNTRNSPTFHHLLIWKRSMKQANLFVAPEFRKRETSLRIA